MSPYGVSGPQWVLSICAIIRFKSYVLTIFTFNLEFISIDLFVFIEKSRAQSKSYHSTTSAILKYMTRKGEKTMRAVSRVFMKRAALTVFLPEWPTEDVVFVSHARWERKARVTWKTGDRRRTVIPTSSLKLLSEQLSSTRSSNDGYMN